MSATLRRTPILLAAMILAGTGVSHSAPSNGKGVGPCATAGPTATLAGPEEPGERLIVSGTIFRPDGATPAPGVILYAYQTDATGVYRKKLWGPPRLQGWIRTDASGRYEMHTIRPGAYPSRNTPAHVHFQLWGGGLPEQWTGELRFQDDPLVAASEKRESASAGRFPWVRQPERDSFGLLRVTFDIRAKPTADKFEEATWGIDACRESLLPLATDLPAE